MRIGYLISTALCVLFNSVNDLFRMESDPIPEPEHKVVLALPAPVLKPEDEPPSEIMQWVVFIWTVFVCYRTVRHFWLTSERNSTDLAMEKISRLETRVDEITKKLLEFENKYNRAILGRWTQTVKGELHKLDDRVKELQKELRQNVDATAMVLNVVFDVIGLTKM